MLLVGEQIMHMKLIKYIEFFFKTPFKFLFWEQFPCTPLYLASLNQFSEYAPNTKGGQRPCMPFFVNLYMSNL